MNVNYFQHSVNNNQKFNKGCFRRDDLQLTLTL